MNEWSATMQQRLYDRRRLLYRVEDNIQRDNNMIDTGESGDPKILQPLHRTVSVQ